MTVRQGCNVYAPRLHLVFLFLFVIRKTVRIMSITENLDFDVEEFFLLWGKHNIALRQRLLHMERNEVRSANKKMPLLQVRVRVRVHTLLRSSMIRLQVSSRETILAANLER